MPSDDVKCYSCGKRYGARHMVAVINKGTGVEPKWTSVDVCDPCWVNPQHRKKAIKGHFFDHTLEERAVKSAGSSMISG